MGLGRRLLPWAALVALVVWMVPVMGQQGGGGNDKLAPHVQGELIVRFHRHVPRDHHAAAVAAVGGVKHDYAKNGNNGVLGDFALVGLKDTLDVAGAIEALKNNPNVMYAEPNYLLHADNTPNDPGFSNLWGMHNTGQTGGTPDADMDLPEAWDITTGSSSIIVAVIDTGVDYNHEDLAANMWTNPDEIPGNGIDDDGNGFIDDVRGWDWVNNDNDPMDDNSHGTHVSGTIAAVGNNGLGVAGVSWNAKIMPLKFLNSSGSGASSNALLALQYATNKGAKVISNSYGGGAYSQAFQDAITAANNAGAIFVASAGNDNTDTPQYPAFYSGVIAVAATDHNDVKASFSNYGTWVDISAPGVTIYSSVPGGYGYKSGTSMSTPNVSGLCALLLGYGISRAEAESLLKNGADNIDGLNAGYEGKLGSGRANAYISLVSYADAQAPSTPVLSGATAISAVQASIDGTPSTDNVKVLRYDVEQSLDGSGFTAVSGTHRGFPVVVSGLSRSTTYYFRARAVDVKGNVSGYSNIVSVTTPANTAPNAPSKPTGYAIVPPNYGEWHNSTGVDPDGDNIKYTWDYGDGQTYTSVFGPSGGTCASYHTWSAEGTYNMRVKTIDTYGAESAWSEPLVVTVVINVAPTVPNVPTGNTPLVIGNTGTYSTGGSLDSTSSTIRYQFDWGDGTSTLSSWMAPGSSYSATHSWSTPGTYYVTAIAQDDHALSSGSSSPLAVTVNDTTNPPTTPSIPYGLTVVGTTTSYPYSTSSTDLDGDTIKYTFDWGDGQTTTTGFFASGVTATASHSWTTTGTYVVKVMATDIRGLTSAWSDTINVTVGTNHPPTTPISMKILPDGTTKVATNGGAYYQCSSGDSDGDKISYVFDWGDGTTNTTGFITSGFIASVEKTYIAAGSYNWKVKAIDINGLESLWTNPFVVTIQDDLTPPDAFTLSATATGSSTISLSWTAPNDDVGLEFNDVYQSTDGVNFTRVLSRYARANTAQTYGATGLQPNTTYYHKVLAIDFVGRTTASSVTTTTTLTVGTPPATPSAPSGPASGYKGTSYSFTTSTTDPEGDQIKYTFDWGDGQTTTTALYASGATATASHSWSAIGTYTVKVKAIDANNNVSGWSGVVTMDIVNRAPGAPSTPSGTTSGSINTSYAYTTSATDADGDQIQYTFDWGDTTTTTTGFYSSGATGSSSHSWNTAGTYVVKVKAIDANGAESSWSTTLSVTINPPNSPPATPSTPSGPTSGNTGTSYTYTTSSTDPESNQIKYTFDWGDGQTTTTGFYASGATGSSSHSWSSAGTYLVKVKAIDANNAESAYSSTLSVTITAGQPDLIMTAVSYSGSSVRRGNSFTASSTAKNQGTTSAGAFVVSFRLSSNTVWGDADDIVVTATRSIGSLAAGATSSGNTSITVPSNTPTGYYYVLAYADGQNAVVESNETNNSRSSTGRIQVK